MVRQQDRSGISDRRRRGQSGSAILEMALMTMLYIPLTLGVAGLGMTMGSFISVLQTTRDAAHMFARGIDFATDANKDLIVRLAGGLNLTRTGGNGSLVFSKIITATQQDCDAAGISSAQCANRDQPVLIHRTRIGDDSLLTSHYGTPTSSIVSSSGNISANNYLRQTSARAGVFATDLAAASYVQGRGEIAYLVEGHFQVPALRFLGFAPNGMYCRFVF
jgi:hypothetical protein